MILTENGVLKLMQRIKSFIASQLNTKANSVHTHTISEIDDLSTLSMGGGYSKSEVDTLLNGKSDTSHTHTKSQITDFPSYGTTANTICEGNDSRLSDARTPTSHTHSKSEITDFPSLATVATSGSYNDLSDKPTIPTVNNATLKIQKNGTDVKSFTANASSDVTCNITVPTKTSDLTNDSGFLTSHQSLSNYSTLANTIKSLSISGKTITYTKGDDTTGTLTTQDNNTWTAMVGATSSSNGSVGYVNAVPPKDGYNTKYLRADGTWQVPPDHTYTVNNATLTIQKNGTDVKTFTANASSDVTCNITVPTKTSDLTNDSGFLTSHQSLSNYSTLANTIKSLSISGKTITVTPGSGNAYTLTTQDTVYTHPTTAGNKHVPSGGSNGQFLGWSADGTAKWVNNPNTNTWTAMVGATSSSNGSVGYVNAVPPKDGYNTKYLRADGTWQVPPDHTYTVNNATLTIQKNGTTVKTFTANASSNVTCNITVPTKTSELTDDRNFTSCLNSTNGISFDWSSTYSNKVGIKVDNTWLGGILTTANTTIPSKTSQLTNDSGFLTSHQSLSGYVPRSGGAVMTAQVLGKTKNDDEFRLDGGTDWDNCASLCLRGKNKLTDAGSMLMNVSNGSTAKQMLLYPSGTWTWTGTAVQLISDQRYKQQITEIDNNLLDAWEDVELVQFKYNDAVNEKGDNARLHTGYVVQQIDEACQKHDVDISEYGLYCHEEYQERTEEVDVEQEDGTIKKETRVIEEASEHYSLRYTETLVVECAYLRRENTRLNDRLTVLEELFKQYIAK